MIKLSQTISLAPETHSGVFLHKLEVLVAIGRFSPTLPTVVSNKGFLHFSLEFPVVVADNRELSVLSDLGQLLQPQKRIFPPLS